MRFKRGSMVFDVELLWLQYGAIGEKEMSVNLSVKNVPDDVAERLRARAKRNHRSLQGELLSILEEAAGPERTVTISELLERGRRLGLSTPSESAQMLREDRDR